MIGAGTTLIFFTFIHFVHDMCPSLLAPLLPLIRESFKLTYFQSGLILSVYTVTSGFSQLLMGWLGDRGNREMLIVIGVGGIGIATLAVGLNQSYYTLLFTLIIMGVLSGAYHPSTISIFPRYFAEQKRGSIVGIHALGGSVGLALGPVLGGIIAGTIGWRFAYIILSIPSILATPLVLKTLRAKWQIKGKHFTADKSEVKTEGKLPGMRQVLLPILTPLILVIASQLFVGCILAFLPMYLVDKYAIAPAYAAMLLGLNRGGAMVGSIAGGQLSDRWGRKQTVFLAVIASGPIIYLLTILPFNSAFIVVLAVFGMIIGMRRTAIQTILIDSVDRRRRATVLGLYFCLAVEGTSLVQPVAGYLMDTFGIIKVFTGLALAMIGLSVVALLLVKKARTNIS
ncbi:MFS transporter [Candidatus Omnitrophota bacterium]